MVTSRGGSRINRDAGGTVCQNITYQQQYKTEMRLNQNIEKKDRLSAELKLG